MSHLLFQIMLLKKVVLHLSDRQSPLILAIAIISTTASSLSSMSCRLDSQNFSLLFVGLLLAIFSFKSFIKANASFATQSLFKLFVFIKDLINLEALYKFAHSSKVSKSEISFVCLVEKLVTLVNFSLSHSCT